MPRSRRGRSSSRQRLVRVSPIWLGLLVLWLVAMSFLPDPRPLGAPEWAVAGLGSLAGLPEPAARFVGSGTLRVVGIALIGLLLSLVLRRVPIRSAAPVGLLVAPALALVVLWINYGYFPLAFQLKAGVVGAILGFLAGLALRRNRKALVAMVLLAGGFLAWGLSTGISTDTFDAARATLLHVVDNADQVPKGDEGFARIVEIAFAFAEDNSHRTDAVLPNEAAILALGVILGDEKVAWVAKREVQAEQMKRALSLRKGITLQGRGDLSQHFWVSAALAVLSDEGRSMTVGIAKELMDATPGGSGFSFVDLTADRAGSLFALAATRTGESASAMQSRIRNGVPTEDFCPDVSDLPEGLSRDELQEDYGGPGGKGTLAIAAEIQRRLATCKALR